MFHQSFETGLIYNSGNVSPALPVFSLSIRSHDYTLLVYPQEPDVGRLFHNLQKFEQLHVPPQTARKMPAGARGLHKLKRNVIPSGQLPGYLLQRKILKLKPSLDPRHANRSVHLVHLHLPTRTIPHRLLSRAQNHVFTFRLQSHTPLHKRCDHPLLIRISGHVKRSPQHLDPNVPGAHDKGTQGIFGHFKIDLSGKGHLTNVTV